MTNKKPWYKKWWVIFLIFIFFLGVISVITDSDEQNDQTNKPEEVEVNETEEIVVNEIIEDETLDFEVLDEKEGETLFVDETRYEVVGITTETDQDTLVKIAEKLKGEYQSKYNEYGDLQVYLFDANSKEDASNYLKISYEESIEKADHYNAITRMTLYRKKDKYSLLYLYDENGDVVKTVEDF